MEILKIIDAEKFKLEITQAIFSLKFEHFGKYPNIINYFFKNELLDIEKFDFLCY